MANSTRLSGLTLRATVHSIRLLLLMFGALTLVTINGAQAQTYTTLHSFSGPDGENPWAGVIFDAAGNLYGTTSRGGDLPACGGDGCGTVFKLAHHSGGWVLTRLHAFEGNDGVSPEAPVVFGPDGTLFGTTNWGGLGYGTVFNLRPPATFCHSVSCPWTITVLHTFTDGSGGGNPGYSSLVFDQQGNAYGTAFGGGSHGAGTVFELTRSNGGWAYNVIYNFLDNPAVQCNPIAGVVFDRSGNLWGTDVGCGGQHGAVFKLSPSGSGWTASLVHAFHDNPMGNNPDGASPVASLTLDSFGNFYGTTDAGPPYPEGSCNALGTVFEINAAGEFTTLHFFSNPACMTGPGPVGPVSLDAQGNIYGTQIADPYGDYGGVFKGTSLGWSELINFSPANGSTTPIGGVALDANGNLYGTTSSPGNVWEITP